MTPEQKLEVNEKDMEEIVVPVEDSEGRIVKKRFLGKYLVVEMESGQENVMAGSVFSVAYTAGGAFAVWIGGKGDNPTVFNVYNSLDAMEDEVPEDVVSAAGSEVGQEYFQDLNI